MGRRKGKGTSGMGIPTIQLGRECISNSLALDFDRIGTRDLGPGTAGGGPDVTGVTPPRFDLTLAP